MPSPHPTPREPHVFCHLTSDIFLLTTGRHSTLRPPLYHKCLCKMQKSAVSRPPPRRKACGQCFRAKRRCGQELPSCLRCRRLKIDCEYLLSTPHIEIDATQVSDVIVNNTEQSYLAPSPSPFVLEDDTLARYLDTDFLSGQWDQQLGMTNTELQEIPDLRVTPQPSVSGLGSHDQALQDVSHEIASRLQYGIDIFKRAPSQMVLENGTPWSHPLLYRYFMPRSMSGTHPESLRV